jgi:bacterioferritin (cytochrome b1)
MPESKRFLNATADLNQINSWQIKLEVKEMIQKALIQEKNSKERAEQHSKEIDFSHLPTYTSRPGIW